MRGAEVWKEGEAIQMDGKETVTVLIDDNQASHSGRFRTVVATKQKGLEETLVLE